MLKSVAFMVAGWILAAGADAAVERTIVAGGEDGYEPFETLGPSGEPEGFNVDLLRAIGAEMGFAVRFDIGPWGPRRRAIESGDIDVLGMFHSAERARQVQFARPHIIVYHRIFLPPGRPTVESLEALAGQTLIVQRDAYSHEFLVESGLPIELVLVDTDAEGLLLLASGQHDAALLTEHRSRLVLSQRGIDSLTISGPPVLPVEYALAVSPGNDALLAQINEGLDRIRASGEFDRIYGRWLQPYTDAEPPSPSRWTTILLILLALLGTGAALRIMALRRALAENRGALGQLEFLRRHDPLTGLLNRHAFEQELGSLLNQGSAPHPTQALLSLDLDRFRVVNENLGHGWGDQVLRELARIIGRHLRNGDLAARLGNDEFALLCPDTGLSDAETLAHRLLDAIHAVDFGTQGKPLALKASIGIVGFGDDTDIGLARLLRRADSALVAAKEGGGDRIHLWRKDDTHLAERRGQLRWVQHIQQALLEQRMAAWWQPIVPADPVADGPYACEFLVRMHSPDGRVVAAAEFMPAAERYFLASQIDTWMVDHVLAWMQRSPDALAALGRCNINLSGRSLGDRRFMDFLERRLKESGELANKLCFEITETALIANLDSAREVLERLMVLGCRFALDDFGMGLSSMAYLRKLPVTYLKIDGSFVRDIDRDPEALRMVREINRLGHAMGKITIAECVETDVLRLVLRDVGVDCVQGYGIGRPAALENLAGWCEEIGRGFGSASTRSAATHDLRG